jgi:hypothetical protein
MGEQELTVSNIVATYFHLAVAGRHVDMRDDFASNQQRIVGRKAIEEVFSTKGDFRIRRAAREPRS